MVKKNKPAKREVTKSDREIGGSKPLEETRQASESALTTIFNIVGMGILVIDTETLTILEVNQTAADIIGRTKEKIMGHICHSFICPAEAGKCPIKDLGQSIDNSERKIICADGQRRDILKNVSPFIFKGRKCYLESFIDISEHRQAEEALARSEERYRTILDNMQDSYIEVDLAGNFTFINEATCRNLGYTMEELIGQNFSIISPGQDELQAIFKAYNEVYKTGEPHKGFAFKVVRKDGATGYAETSISILQNEQGRTIGFRSVGRDVTERKQVEDKLRESEEQYRLLSEHMTDSVWLMDMNLKTTYHSPSVEKIRGFTPLEIMELPLEQNLTPESLKLVSAMFLEEIPRVETDPDYNPVRILELEYYCKDGTTAWAENKFSIIRDPNGKPVSILGEARDCCQSAEWDTFRAELFGIIR